MMMDDLTGDGGQQLSRLSFPPHTGSGSATYMLASHVARHLQLSVEELFDTYPRMYRRHATDAEKECMPQVTQTASLVTLVLADEVDMLLSDDPRAEQLQAQPGLLHKQDKFGHLPIKLTKSTHAPPAPIHQKQQQPGKKQEPVITARAARAAAALKPRNPFAGYYSAPQGMTTEASVGQDYLVPITLALDFAGHKLHDSFLYNANDTSIDLGILAQSLCQDHEIPFTHAAEIQAAIKTQIEAAQALAAVDPEPAHYVIDLEVRFGTTLLVDRFEWDPNCSLNSPEDFATVLCTDLSLPSEYAPKIAIALHTELQRIRRAAAENTPTHRVPYVTGVDQVFRTKDVLDWSPSLVELSKRELTKRKHANEREQRRRRRGDRNYDETKHKKTRRAQQLLQQQQQAAADKAASVHLSGAVLPRLQLPTKMPKLDVAVRRYLEQKRERQPVRDEIGQLPPDLDLMLLNDTYHCQHRRRKEKKGSARATERDGGDEGDVAIVGAEQFHPQWFKNALQRQPATDTDLDKAFASTSSTSTSALSSISASTGNMAA